MYIQRKIDKFLDEWKRNKNRKPLIVKGARQIGKTESIRNFARKNYKNVIEINFVENIKFRGITADGYDVDSIVTNISRINPFLKFSKGETLLFFDEIQAYPDIATSLKFFCADGNYDVICSGSLLGINYQQIESNSVGYKEDYQMYSLDFEEFLWAKGYDNNFVQEIFSHMCDITPFNELTHKILNTLFLDYCILGGMPAVVKLYLENKTFEGTLKLQQQLMLDYQEDVRKYAVGMDQTRILNVFRHIPVQLAKENKKFQISKVAKGARFGDYRGCIEWLQDSGIVNICYCLNFPELPLKGNYDDSKMKIYFADTGLLVANLDEEAQEDLRVNKNLNTYKGALYENIVAEALVKSGYELYYYRRENSTLEEDFFVRSKTELLPLEVKADNGRSKSLRTLVNSEYYADIKHGIKLSKNNIGFDGCIYTFPYYCAFLLKRWIKTIE